MNPALVDQACRFGGRQAADLTGMFILIMFSLVGCATWQAPESVDDSALRTRAISETVMDVTLSATVLGSNDSQRLFATDLNSTGVQPVWIEVKNNTSHTLWLLRAGTDPSYFSPLEVAWPLHTKFNKDGNAEIDKFFESISFTNPIPPGRTQSGILFTNRHKNTHVLNVDLLGQQTFFPFTLFLPIPGEHDSKIQEGMNRLASVDYTDYQNTGAFRAALEQLPCCTSEGDPVNVVLVGEIANIAAAFIRRGYRSQRHHIDDRHMLFDRPADIVMRKSGERVTANWIRVWVSPLRYQGQPVLFAQSGRPKGGRFEIDAFKEPQLHPDVDESRNLLIQDLLYSGGLAQMGFVRGVGTISRETADSADSDTRYHSDGLRAVLFFVIRPLTPSDIVILDWVPLIDQRVNEAAARHMENNQRE